MFGIGFTETLVILVFGLIFLGPKKLPELAKSIGKAIREFQSASNDIMNPSNYDSENPQKKIEDTSSLSDEGSVEIDSSKTEKKDSTKT